MRIYLMASHGYHPGRVFHPEQGLPRIPKDCQPLNPELRQSLMRSGSLAIGSYQNEEPWKPVSGLFDSNQFVRIDSTIKRPVLIDVQDNRPNSTLFSYGIAKQCTRHEKILKFLMSGSSEVERDGLDLSILSDLMGLQAMTMDLSQRPLFPDQKPHFPEIDAQIEYPSSEFDSPKPLVDFVGDLVRRSEITVHPDGRVTISGTGTEMKDVLSILAEFYLSKNSVKWRKQSLLVPQFNRLDSTEVRAYESTMGLEAMTFAPLKCPEKVKFAPSPKKKSNRKAVKERNLYRRNNFQACETLLSVIVDKKRNGRAAIPELKKSGPELPQLLTQFSASIAGTGIALLFSVVCKVASGRVPFCASKALNTGLGLGLVWLSWAVNRLRDTIISINKNSSKKCLKEEEMVKNLDRSVKDIYFRAATLMAVVVLRLA